MPALTASAKGETYVSIKVAWSMIESPVWFR